jgi:hypothetical protein
MIFNEKNRTTSVSEINVGLVKNKKIFTIKSSKAGSMEGTRADLLFACKYSLKLALPTNG